MRILQKVSENGLPVLIRGASQPDTAVKARAAAPKDLSTSNGMRLANISTNGRIHLAMHSNNGVQVEFVLMSTKVVFNTKVLMLEENAMIVEFPKVLVTIERRKDGRFPMNPQLRSCVRLPNWRPDIRDITSPPYFEYQKDQVALIQVGDISLGGISLSTRFPSVSRALSRDSVINRAQVIFSLATPVMCNLEVRWVKKIRDNTGDSDGINRISRLYKFGIRFVEPSSELITSLQTYIQKLSQAEAI